MLTSPLDPEAYPAAEIIALYHERWEIELGFDEVKTHTLERQEAMLRCKAPERITQELWGLALAYNLVRLAMARVARQAGVSPTRISYRHALNFIRLFWLSAHLVSPGALPRRLDALHQELALLILPLHRPRRFLRAVKIKMTRFPVNYLASAVARLSKRHWHKRGHKGPILTECRAFDPLSGPTGVCIVAQSDRGRIADKPR